MKAKLLFISASNTAARRACEHIESRIFNNEQEVKSYLSDENIYDGYFLQDLTDFMDNFNNDDENFIDQSSYFISYIYFKTD